MKPTKLIEKFRNYLIQIGHNQSTVYMLPSLILEFLIFTRKGAKPEDIITEDIHHFMEHLHVRPLKRRSGVLSDAMKNHYAYALRTFFIWMESTDQIESNPASNYEFTHYKHKEREPLTQSEIKKLFDATDNYRDKSLLHLFYSCGLRRTEGVKLEVNDIDLNKKLLYVREGKGCKRRVIPITGIVRKDFYYYLEKERAQTNTNAFILGYMGKGMRGDMMNRVIQRLGKKAGITKEFSLHYLRHSIATHLLEQGLRIEYVQNFLGHSGIESTQIYTKVKKASLKDF